ncbi:MAG: hypothetical protein QF473_03985 [Planctomycetota bacterium]|nr:hypothetical protein [Planctomycetota bacterium]
MTAEERILIDGEFRWVKRTPGSVNDTWDTEYYALAYAHYRQVERYRTFAEDAEISVAKNRQRQLADEADTQMRTPDGRDYLISDRE